MRKSSDSDYWCRLARALTTEHISILVFNVIVILGNYYISWPRIVILVFLSIMFLNGLWSTEHAQCIYLLASHHGFFMLINVHRDIHLDLCHF
jgi:hypothetical protein